MSLLIRNVFEQACPDLVADELFAKKIVAYQLAFVAKNDDHVKFFGGHLTGVQIVRFTPSDRAVWFEEILHADDYSLQQKLYKLPTVNPNHNVASDAMNLSCYWVIHLLTQAKIPDKLKHDALISCALILQYKFLTSRLSRHFKFPAVESVAEATYATLSMKFDLKQYGNWQAYLTARAEDIVDPHSPRYVNFVKMDNDRQIELIINDIQTRLRKTLKLIAGTHYRVAASGYKIVSTSQIVEHDGQALLKDKTHGLAKYTRYIQSIIPDKGSFIREELLQVVEKQIATMPPHLFRASLDWLSDNFQGPRADELHKHVSEIMIHCFDYLVHNSSAVQNGHDLVGLLVRLRGVYTSARSTDPILFSLRDETEKIVKLATGTRNVSLLSPIRTGVLLYIALRALAMRHYSGG